MGEAQRGGDTIVKDLEPDGEVLEWDGDIGSVVQRSNGDYEGRGDLVGHHDTAEVVRGAIKA